MARLKKKILKMPEPLTMIVNGLFLAFFVALFWAGPSAELESSILQVSAPLPPADEGLIPFPEKAHFDDSRLAFAASQPIFHSDRRPVQPPPPVVEEVPAQTVALEVTGIVKTTGARGWAFLRPKAGGETEKVEAGDDFAGWRVMEIGPHSVLLTNGSQTATLYVIDPQGLADGATASQNSSPNIKPRTRRKGER